MYGAARRTFATTTKSVSTETPNVQAAKVAASEMATFREAAPEVQTFLYFQWQSAIKDKDKDCGHRMDLLRADHQHQMAIMRASNAQQISTLTQR